MKSHKAAPRWVRYGQRQVLEAHALRMRVMTQALVHGLATPRVETKVWVLLLWSSVFSMLGAGGIVVVEWFMAYLAKSGGVR